MSYTKLSDPQSLYLDFLRAMAAMAVLFGHSAHFFLTDNVLLNANIGGLGVFLFFLLSGFLISYSVFNKHDRPDYTFTSYFIDRFCRIYSAFIPALLFVWVVDIQTLSLPTEILAGMQEPINLISNISAHANLYTFVGNLFMLQDFPVFQVARVAGMGDSLLFIDTFGSAKPFWTISIEWWIYMLFGGIFFFYVREKRKITVLSVLVLSFVAIEPLYHFVGGPDQCLTMLWVLGMLACMLFLRTSKWIKWSEQHVRLFAILVFLFALLLMAVRVVAIKLDGQDKILEFQFGTYLAIAVFSFLFVLGSKVRLHGAMVKTIRFVADYSYSLYLCHFSVVAYLYIRFPDHDNDLFLFWGAIIASNLSAILLWYCFERHHRKLSKWMKKYVGRWGRANATC